MATEVKAYAQGHNDDEVRQGFLHRNHRSAKNKTVFKRIKLKPYDPRQRAHYKQIAKKIIYGQEEIMG